jgi:transcriptional regulator with XRE-family HTH domain
MNLNNKTAVKIKEAREAKNISQQAMAKRLAMSDSAYSRLENGKVQITLNIVEKLSQELSVSITELLSLAVTETNNFTNSSIIAQRGTINLSLSGEDLEKIISIINAKEKL